METKQKSFAVSVRRALPGGILCAAAGLLARLAAPHIPGLGTVTMALILGLAGGNLLPWRDRFIVGVTWSEKKLLPWAIALLGVELEFHTLAGLGWKALVFVLIQFTLVIAGGFLIGRLWGLSKTGSILLASGNGVCGSSAIGGVAGVVEPDQQEIGLSVAVVNLMGSIGIFLVPWAAGLVFSNPDTIGQYIGGILQSVGQVAAAGYGAGETVGAVAMVTKMTRVLMLGPLIFFISIFQSRRGGSAKSKGFRFPVPPFIIVFFILALVSAATWFPGGVRDGLSWAGHLALAVAMAGIGYRIDLRSIRKSGGRFLGAELCIMTLQMVSAAGLLYLLGC